MALTLGNTPHVNEAYCSVPLLSEADIEDNEEDMDDMHLFISWTPESRLYIVYLVDLAKRSIYPTTQSSANIADFSQPVSVSRPSSVPDRMSLQYKPALTESPHGKQPFPKHYSGTTPRFPCRMAIGRL